MNEVGMILIFVMGVCTGWNWRDTVDLRRRNPNRKGQA